MATTTTLMTFMVRTPPTTRSVTLWGSWDNFAAPYPMSRDSQIGPEHWSGCHSFTNIICDGNLSAGSRPRQGGLKMGGTYWYFYKLDDDWEFHNSAEPATTQCPMLPGQLVNVLNVPFALSGNRSRKASVSSTSSDLCTLDPHDKFINPRPVPTPKPQLRLRTSPTVPQDTWPSHTPSSTTSSRDGRSATSAGPPSASTLRLRSKSPGSGLSGSIRSAFRSLRTPRSRSPESRSPISVASSSSKEESQFSRPALAAAGTHISSTETTQTLQSPVEHDLLFRRAGTAGRSSDIGEVRSFQQHRRQRSASRDPSPLRNALMLEFGSPEIFNEASVHRKQQLSTVREITSIHNTPAKPRAMGNEAPPSPIDDVNLEKRLPTLPNTPSSAYPPSTVFSETLDLEALQSHFSSTTMDSSGSEDEIESSIGSLRFSNWTGSYTNGSNYAESITDDEAILVSTKSTALTPRRSPAEGGHVDTEFEDTPQRSQGPKKSLWLFATSSRSNISSVHTTSLPSSPIESEQGPSLSTSPLKRQASSYSSRFRYQHYRLPISDFGSEVTIKSPVAKREGVVEVSNNFDVRLDQPQSSSEPMVAHSASMQQLMQELSYLGDMIHQN